MIEKYIYKGEGYNPFLIREGWQVAKLNYVAGHGLNDIKDVEVHKNTDEVFILTEGEGFLVEADIQNDHLVSYEVIKMEKGVVYNVPKNVWHNIAMNKSAELFIIEKSNTHLNDVTYFDLSSEQLASIYKLMK